METVGIVSGGGLNYYLAGSAEIWKTLKSEI
jgi:hypothetical protein